MSYKFKFYRVGGQVCCQGNDDDFPKFCASCKKKAGAQELAWRQANAKRNDMLQRQQEEQARIDAARGNPGTGKDNQMRIGQGQNQTPAPAGCRCGKCGGTTTAKAPSPAPAVTPAASPLRAATIARLAPRFPGRDLNSIGDEALAALDIMFTASASTPAPASVLRELPDPLGLKAHGLSPDGGVLSPAPVVSAAPASVPTTLSVAQSIAVAQGILSDPYASFASSAAAYQILERAGKVTPRDLPDPLGLKDAEARRAESAQNEEAKKLEERRIEKEKSGWDGVNAMVKAAQQQANANRAEYEALEQARAAARSNPNSKLRELPDPLGLRKLGIIK